MLVDVNIKGAPDAVSDGNEEHVIGTTGEKANLVIKYTTKTWLRPSVLYKVELVVMNLDIYPRRFLSKVLKMQPDFLLLHAVKCERREIN